MHSGPSCGVVGGEMSLITVLGVPRYLLENMDWFEEELGEYDDDYLIIDCPGAFSFCTSLVGLLYLIGYTAIQARSSYTLTIHSFPPSSKT